MVIINNQFIQMPIMPSFALKCGEMAMECGKLRWKCAKLPNLQGGESWILHFSTLLGRGKVEKTTIIYTNAENRGVEKNKFSSFYLTEIYSKEGRLFTLFKNILVYFAQNSWQIQQNQGAWDFGKSVSLVECSEWVFVILTGETLCARNMCKKRKWAEIFVISIAIHNKLLYYIS